MNPHEIDHDAIMRATITGLCIACCAGIVVGGIVASLIWWLV